MGFGTGGALAEQLHHRRPGINISVLVSKIHEKRSGELQKAEEEENLLACKQTITRLATIVGVIGDMEDHSVTFTWYLTDPAIAEWLKDKASKEKKIGVAYVRFTQFPTSITTANKYLGYQNALQDEEVLNTNLDLWESDPAKAFCRWLRL